MYLYRPMAISLSDKVDLQDCLEVGRVAQVRERNALILTVFRQIFTSPDVILHCFYSLIKSAPSRQNLIPSSKGKWGLFLLP